MFEKTLADKKTVETDSFCRTILKEMSEIDRPNTVPWWGLCRIRGADERKLKIFSTGPVL